MQSRFGLEHVFAWHSLYGYWAGVSTESPDTATYGTQLVWPQPSNGAPAHYLNSWHTAQRACEDNKPQGLFINRQPWICGSGRCL